MLSGSDSSQGSCSSIEEPLNLVIYFPGYVRLVHFIVHIHSQEFLSRGRGFQNMAHFLA